MKRFFLIFGFLLVLNILSLFADYSVSNNALVFANTGCSSQRVPGSTARSRIVFPATDHGEWVCSTGSPSEVYEGQCYAGEWLQINLCTQPCSGGDCGGKGEDSGTASKDCEKKVFNDDRVQITFPAMSDGDTACKTFGNKIWSGMCINGFLETKKCTSVCIESTGLCDDLEHPDDVTPGGGNTGPGTGGAAPPEITGLLPVIYNAIKFFFSFIAVIAAAMVVYGAYMWMFSGGDPQKVKLAQGTLTWAIIGLVFFIMIVVFFDFILRLFGITLPKPTDTGIF